MPCFKRDIKVTWLVQTGYISIQFIKDRTLKYAMFQTGYKGDLVSANRIYVTVHAKTLRKSAILISRYRSRRHEWQFILFSRFFAHKVRMPS